MSIIQGTSKSSAAAAHTIDQSIRFDSVRNSDLTRTLSGDGNLKTGTFSFWMKRSGLGSLQEIFTTYSIRSSFFFQSNDTLSMQIYNGASYTTLTTTAVFRDPSAFAHYLFRWDTTQATDTDRLQFYYNGVLQTVTGAYPAQNSTTTFSDATYTHVISGDGPANTLYEIDGYLAEIHYVDGTALAATDFGEYNANGVWVPIKYTGTYGTNGFYITGADSADLGADDSGNGNDFTSSGLTAADQVSDSPTDNQSTLNPLWAGATLSDGNLVATASGNSYQWAVSTFAVDDGGKYVAEFQKSSGTFGYVGLYQLGNHTATTGNNYGYFYNLGTGEIVKNGSVVTDLGTGAANSLMRLEYDSATDTLEFFDDGSSIHSATTGLSGHNSLHFGCAPYASGTAITATFSPLSGTPTTGFNELTAANLDDPTIADPSAYFQTTLYTGNGTAIGSGGKAVDQSGNSTFQPDFVWIKNQSAADNHMLYDAVRGATKDLHSNSTAAEVTDTEGLSTFDTDGFTVGSNVEVNTNTENYAAWQWKANGAGSSNTDGTVTSTVSADATSGFSIAKWTHTTASNYTVGHGLGAVPKMIIVKTMDQATNWGVYHSDITVGNRLILNTTSAQVAGYWGANSWTSSTFSIGSARDTNGSTMIGYCFAEVEGFSKIGSYTGNGSTDGPFIYTGFMPEFIIVKSSSNAGTNWDMLDATREPFNDRGNQFEANTSDAEANNDHNCDFLSNGFKWRDASGSNNGSGYTIIYMAFSRSPFKTSNAQ